MKSSFSSHSTITDADIQHKGDKEESKEEEKRDEKIASRQHSVTRPTEAITDSPMKEDTGKWGVVSQKEKIIVAIVSILILAGIIVMVTVLVSGNKPSTSKNNASFGNTPTEMINTTNGGGVGDGGMNNSLLQSPLSIFENLDDKYTALLKILDDNPYTSESAFLLPTNVGDLDSFTNSTHLADPLVQATKWIIQTDKNMIMEELNDRLAFAITYYTNGGDNWVDNELWLSDQHICSWGGNTSGHSKCKTVDYTSGMQVIQELDLTANNLVGTISSSLSLLSSLKGISLKENALTGTIPGDALGSLPELIILYLQHNQLIGDIPSSLITSGSLGSLYLYGNNFTGSWPNDFCPSEQYPEGRFTQFGLNCIQTPCPEFCCFEDINCFA